MGDRAGRSGNDTSPPPRRHPVLPKRLSNRGRRSVGYSRLGHRQGAGTIVLAAFDTPAQLHVLLVVSISVSGAPVMLTMSSHAKYGSWL